MQLMPTCVNMDEVQYYIAQSSNTSINYTECDEEVPTATRVSPTINGTTVTVSINKPIMEYDGVVIIAKNGIGCDISEPLSLTGKVQEVYHYSLDY